MRREADGERAIATIALLKMFSATSGDVARACVAVLAGVGRGDLTRLTWHGLGQILEDQGLAAEDTEVWESLVDSGLFRQEGKVLLANQTLSLRDLYDELAPGDDVDVSVEVVADLLAEPEAEQATVAVTPRELVRSCARVTCWGFQLLEYAMEHDLSGFPVFWEREGDDSRPFGTDLGSFSSSDTLLLVVEAARYGMPLPELLPQRDAAVWRAWDQLLRSSVERPGDWYDGAVAFDVFDDDFVGAFTKAHADRGSCPTLDATAERLYALTILSTYAAVWAPDLAARSVDAIDAAARCIIRWQDDSGGWAIHRYGPAVGLTMPLRDISSRHAADALLLAQSRSAVSQELSHEIDRVLRRFGDLLIRTSRRKEGQAYWLGDWIDDEEDQRVRATCLFAIVLGAMDARLGDNRLRDLQAQAIAYLSTRWSPDPQRVLKVEFRVPTWEGPALSTFTWEPPADALIVLAIMDGVARGHSLDDAALLKLYRAVAGILATESHGSWMDAEMAGEGMFKAFASNSLHSLRALLAALAWESQGTPSELVSALQTAASARASS